MKIIELTRQDARRYFLFAWLWLPFITITLSTIDSLHWLSIDFNKVFLVPDRHVLELLFFTLMMPVCYWCRKQWPEMSSVLKYVFLAIVSLGTLNLAKYIIVGGYLVTEELIK